jgi:hypothetical protein
MSGGKEASGRKILKVHGRVAWISWVAGLARHRHHTMARLVEEAIAQYAASTGYAPPPHRVDPR